MSHIKIGNYNIGGANPTFIIAEAGSNHDGKLKQAYELIDAAKVAGANAVKFQLFRAAKVYPKNIGLIELNRKKFDLYKFLKESEISNSWIPKLKVYCDKKGIIFLCTPCDEDSADVLEKNGVLAYKVASPELNHIPLLRHIAKKGKPIIMSDGLNTLGDIELGIETVRKEGNDQIILLHCLSAYPAPAEEYNLNFIKSLSNVFGVVAGLSDHTATPILLPTLAVCNGARVVEKHFTLSRKLVGADHFFALEPKELKEMVKKIREVERYSDSKKHAFLSKHQDVLGSYQKVIAPSEQEIYPGDKRSIFSIKPIKKGEKLSEKNIAVLRAERNLTPGMHPRYFDLILKKTAKKNISINQGIQWPDVLN